MSQSILSIYRSGIGEIVGERTMREPPNNIDSISSQYPSIYTTLGKRGRTYQEGTSQKHCHLFYFNYPTTYLSDIGEISGGCTRRKPPKIFVINEFHISLSICRHGKMSALHRLMSSIYLSDIGEIATGGNLGASPYTRFLWHPHLLSYLMTPLSWLKESLMIPQTVVDGSQAQAYQLLSIYLVTLGLSIYLSIY
jgi:hypothetical protein